MGIRDIAFERIGKPLLRNNQPEFTGNLARRAFDRAIEGVGPIRGAVADAEKQLAEAHGDPERAIDEVISDHTRMAAAEGFVTNLGGLVSMAVLVPTNIAGLALLHCRMVAEIAHLRGYDLSDPRVRNAVFATILGKDVVRELVDDKKLPDTPRGIATGAPLDAEAAKLISSAVIAELVARAAGKSTFAFFGKRMPVVGGFVGGATDLWATRRIGKYADKELTRLK